ncbi:Flp family type IVb pilin [Aminobacterium mobile]|jgi:pilus assembly protein Flp/PilA|uniref:Flp family type IVb pilin n=1 Tax=Aminobacterium mobile TaxID=81467 RepID=UPI0004632D17|nr:Flp family type IVb pilin [Aminobacterium mobile]
MLERLRNLVWDEEGQGMVEYGLIIALVSLAVILILGALGGSLKQLFQDAKTELDKRPTS